MTERKWTPGPWVYDEESQGEWGTNYSIQQYDNRLIDVAEMVGTKEDAHLIAAAPELYEALEAFTDDSDCHDEAEWFEARLRDARAALAKARGEA